MPASARVLAVVAGGLSVALAAPCLLQKPRDWEKVYVPAAERLRAGGDVADERTGFVYPPFAALVAVPAAVLPHGAGRGLWWFANAVAGAVAFAGAWRLAGGSFSDPRRWPRAEIAAFWAGLLAVVGFTFDAVTNQQTDLILAGLVIGGCWAIARGRGITGGTLIGLAAAAKCTPLLFAPYLAWTGRWRAAAAVVAAAAGANLLPDVLYPPADGRPRVVAWATRFLPSVSSPKVDPGVWFSGVQFNHSLGGIANRLFTADLASANGVRFPVPRADRVGPGELKAGVLAVGLGFALLAAFVSHRRPTAEHSDAAFGAEVGLALTLMLLLSPMSSKPHFCTLVLPAWVVARAAAGGNRGVLGFAAAAFTCGVVANKDLVGGRVYDTLLWYGVVPAATTLLFAGCGLVRWRAGATAVAERDVLRFPERPSAKAA